jgi:hypothetical protein
MALVGYDEKDIWNRWVKGASFAPKKVTPFWICAGFEGHSAIQTVKFRSVTAPNFLGITGPVMTKEKTMSDPKVVVVHGFKIYNFAEDREQVQPSKRTAEEIERIGGEIIESTAETVDASLLDPYGRYYCQH